MDTKTVKVEGRVCRGRALAGRHLAEHAEQLSQLLGASAEPGSLNIALLRPLRLSSASGTWLGRDRHRMAWDAQLNERKVLLYRWQGCPLSVVEVISAEHLRTELQLKDGALIALRIRQGDVENVGVRAWLGWVLLWKWRSELYYKGNYGSWTVTLQKYFDGSLGTMALIKKVIGRLSGLSKQGLRRLWWGEDARGYDLVRRNPRSGSEGELDKVLNLLAYAKSSDRAYSAKKYPAGYHTLDLGGCIFAGQRLPATRLDLLPISLEGLSVLDVGCNQGGMLFEAVRRGISWGVGIDYDSRMINAASKIKQYRQASNLDFFVFDLEKEQLSLVHDFLPREQVDIIFLLSVCMWIENWKDVIASCAMLAPRMLFESNGSDEQQDEQAKCLREHFKEVTVLQLTSEDDETQKRRRLYFCTR